MSKQIKFTPEQSQFIENYTHLIPNNESWYYIPFWFKKIDENIFEQVSFENLPIRMSRPLKRLNKYWRGVINQISLMPDSIKNVLKQLLIYYNPCPSKKTSLSPPKPVNN